MVEKTHGFEHPGEGPLWEALGALVEKTHGFEPWGGVGMCKNTWF